MDNNSTLAYFNAEFCLENNHVGMTVLFIIMSLCFLLGTPAHSWFLWFSLRPGWNIRPTQVFFFNHTVLDLIYCTQCALEMLNVLIFNSDQIWTEIYVLFSLTWVGRPLMQICICVEQYLAVLHPVIFLKYKGLQYRIAPAVVVWLVAVAYATYQMFINNFPDPMFDCVFFSAVAVISFCCVSVLHVLKHPGPGDTQITTKRGRDVGNQQKRNAFKTIFSGLLIILFSYLPQTSLTIFTAICINKDLCQCDIIPLINSFNILGAMIPPLLKMRDAHLKCLNHPRGSNVDR